MKSKLSPRHPVNFFTLSFYSAEKERKFRKEYTDKSKNTVRLGLLLIGAMMLTIHIYEYFGKDKNGLGWAILDTFFLGLSLLLIFWSYFDFEYFATVLQPIIGLGLFLYMVMNVIVVGEPTPPTVYMLLIVSYFLIKVAFKFIAIYNILFMLYYQVMYIFVFPAGVRLVANNVLLLNTIVCIISGSYVYEYLLRKSFLKKEMFIVERRKLIEEKRKNRIIIHNVLPTVIADKWIQTHIDGTENGTYFSHTILIRPEAQLLNKSKLNTESERDQDDVIIADTFEDACLLYIDISNLSLFCDNANNKHCGAVIHDIFTRLDSLVEKCQFVRLKTFGSRYIVGANFPSASDTPHLKMCELAIDISKEMGFINDSLGTNLNVKCAFGIGKLSAGVCGLRRFSYDFWGELPDEVETLLESNVKGICVTRAAHARLVPLYTFEEVAMPPYGMAFMLIGRSTSFNPELVAVVTNPLFPNKTTQSRSNDGETPSSPSETDLKRMAEEATTDQPRNQGESERHHNPIKEGKRNVKSVTGKVWWKKQRTEEEQEIKRNIKFSSTRGRLQLKLPSNLRNYFLWEYEKKSIKPLRGYFVIVCWAIAILGPAQDLSTLKTAKEFVPFLVARYCVMVPAMMLLLIPAVMARWFDKLVPWIQFMWAIYMLIIGFCELVLTATSASALGKEYFICRYIQIVIYGFTIFRLGFAFSFSADCILLAAYNIATIIGTTSDKQYFTDIWRSLFYIVVSILMSLKASWSLEKHAKQDFLLKRLVELERKRIQKEQEAAEKLIFELFPRKIAMSIKRITAESPPFMIDRYNTATVLCATVTMDVNYLEPKKTVDILNKLYGAVEHQADHLGLELIRKNANKTLLIIGGVKDDNGPQVEQLVDLAKLLLLSTARANERDTNMKISIQIGIHTGSLLFGLASSLLAPNSTTPKFNYDIWGTTALVTMEIAKSCPQNSILLSEESYFYIANRNIGFVAGKEILAQMNVYRTVMLGDSVSVEEGLTTSTTLPASFTTR